jgi:hypothetical protein
MPIHESFSVISFKAAFKALCFNILTFTVHRSHIYDMHIATHMSSSDYPGTNVTTLETVMPTTADAGSNQDAKS